MVLTESMWAVHSHVFTNFLFLNSYQAIAPRLVPTKMRLSICLKFAQMVSHLESLSFSVTKEELICAKFFASKARSCDPKVETKKNY